jgi:hypothetical protein
MADTKVAGLLLQQPAFLHAAALYYQHVGQGLKPWSCCKRPGPGWELDPDAPVAAVAADRYAECRAARADAGPGRAGLGPGSGDARCAGGCLYGSVPPGRGPAALSASPSAGERRRLSLDDELCRCARAKPAGGSGLAQARAVGQAGSPDAGCRVGRYFSRPSLGWQAASLAEPRRPGQGAESGPQPADALASARR